MTAYGPRLLTPPLENKEIYPYGPVWRIIIIETVLLIILTGIIFIVTSFVKVSLPEQVAVLLNIFLATTPCQIWIITSIILERNALEPRQSLYMTFVITALMASAVSLPFINTVLEVDKWLPLSNAIIRIVGYTITAGLVQEVTKYLVLRFTIWPRYLRVRVDSVAYGVAAGIGYATVANLDFVFRNNPLPLDSVILRIFANYAVHISGSVIIAYGLAEVRFNDPNPFFMTFATGAAALVTGIAIPIRAGLVSPPFSLTTPAIRPLLGLGFSLILLMIVILIVSTLINNAERRRIEASIGLED